MKITVVIPTYNTGNRLYTLFGSIMSQTFGFENIEVIFVDDASTDKHTLAILKELDIFDNVSVVYLKDNSGFPGRGRNIGLEKAQGEYVIFSDHDDSYNPDAFEKLYKEITRNGSDMVISNFFLVNEDKRVPFHSGIRRKITLDDFRDDLRIFQINPTIWTRLFRKDFLTENNISFLEGMLCEDLYVTTMANLKAKNIVYLPRLYSYNYSIRDSEEDKSTIHLRNKKYVESILDGYFEVSKWVSENYPQYGKDVFRKHLTSWLYTIVLSEIPDEDRLNLFRKSKPLFVKYYSKDPHFKKEYVKFANLIMDDKFEEAVDKSREIAKHQVNINHKVGWIEKLKKKIRR